MIKIVLSSHLPFGILILKQILGIIAWLGRELELHIYIPKVTCLGLEWN